MVKIHFKKSYLRHFLIKFMRTQHNTISSNNQNFVSEYENKEMSTPLQYSKDGWYSSDALGLYTGGTGSNLSRVTGYPICGFSWFSQDYSRECCDRTFEVHICLFSNHYLLSKIIFPSYMTQCNLCSLISIINESKNQSNTKLYTTKC
jgi:hypothetical protein